MLMTSIRALAALSLLLTLTASALAQSSPPTLVHYQGVLRDAEDAPLSGEYSMVFAFFSAETEGDEILIDEHLASGTGPVVVSGGLFSVAMGSGQIRDGSGPGSYESLGEVFRDYGEVFVEIQVGETSSLEKLAPRVRVLASAYALNAASLQGRDADAFVDVTSTDQTKSGDLSVANLTVSETNLDFQSGSSIEGLADALRLQAGVDQGDDLFLSAGTSASNGRIAIFGSSLMELRAGNGNFRFVNDLGEQIASLNPSGIMRIDGSLTIGDRASNDLDILGFDDGAEELRWVPNTNRFELTDTLRLTGSATLIVGTSAELGFNAFGASSPSSGAMTSPSDVYAGDVELFGRAYLSRRLFMEGQNVSGADGDQSIFFYEDGDRDRNYLRWDDARATSCGSSIGDIDSAFEWNIGSESSVATAWIFNNDDDIEAAIDDLGNLHLDGSVDSASSCDVAEAFFGDPNLPPGTLVALDPTQPERVVPTSHAYDRLLAGVVSTQPGILLRGPSASAYPLIEEMRHLRNELANLPRSAPTPSDEGVENAGAAEARDDAEPLELAEVAMERARLAERIRELEGQLEGWERGNVAVALVGRVPVRADASHGPIRPGDPLTSSATPGVAARLVGPGPTIGVAMSELDDGEGRVLVMLARGWHAGTDAGAPSAETRRHDVTPIRAEASKSATDAVVSHRLVQDDAPPVEAPPPQSTAPACDDAPRGRDAFAEPFAVREPVEPGVVLVADPDDVNAFRASTDAADPTVVGVVVASALASAETTGTTESDSARVLVAVGGTTAVRVDAGYGSVRRGDLLTTSPTKGHAMRALDAQPGTIIGKALEPLDVGTGTIRMLVLMR